jgi:hypothetical protein
MSRSVTFPIDDWTAAGVTTPSDDARATLRQIVFQEEAELIEPLPPPPVELVPRPPRERWEVPWAFLLSAGITLALLWCASAIR